MVPDLTIALYLALATFRIVRLIGWDDFPPIARLRGRITGQLPTRYSASEARGPIIEHRRETLAKFIECAWCQGFWVGCAVYVAWLAAPTAALYVLFPFALNGAVGIIARMLDP